MFSALKCDDENTYFILIEDIYLNSSSAAEMGKEKREDVGVGGWNRKLEAKGMVK